jgi:hypothetical protein
MQPDQARERFWQWFVANADRLRAAMYGPDDAAREEASAEMRDAVEEVAPGLILEFGRPPGDGPGQLVVSADGRPERVDPVKEFVASAPGLPGWEVVAFRPRMPVGESIEIVLQGERVGPEDIWFRVAPADDGLDLTLHVRGLTSENERLRGLGALLLAQHAVGERDALTLLTGLRVEPLPDTPAAAGLRPFRELVGVFDAAKVQRYPPPGRLSVSPEGDWQMMEGTIGGAPALVLLHAGLRPVTGHPVYDSRLVVSVPFHESRPDGMPATGEEYEAASAVGDRVGETLQQGQQSLLAMTITGRGRRDLVFYTWDPAGALDRLAAVRAEGQSHAVEAEVEWDTFWGMYRAFCDAAAGGAADE